MSIAGRKGTGDPAITGVISNRAEAPSAVGAVAAGVREYPDVDAPGHDRGSWVPNVSSEDCKKICLADNGCVGYTYNRRQLACFPKNSIGHLYPSSEPAVTGIIESGPARNSTVCAHSRPVAKRAATVLKRPINSSAFRRRCRSTSFALFSASRCYSAVLADN
jgi:PAN domain